MSKFGTHLSEQQFLGKREIAHSSALELKGIVLVPTNIGVTVKSDTVVNAKFPLRFHDLGESTALPLSNDPDTHSSSLQMTELFCYELNHAVTSGSLIREFGGEEKVRVTLSEFTHLILNQEQKDGMSLKDGFCNVAFIKNDLGLPCTIFAHWRSDKWFMDTESIHCRYSWQARDRIFSRNPVR